MYPLDDQCAELAALTADQATTDQNIGTKLLKHIEEQARAKSLQSLLY